MSRHRLEPRADQAHLAEVFLGWDRPLQTFFLQVYDRKGALRRWVGTRLEEIAELNTAVVMASRYAVVPAEIEQALAREQADSPAEADSPLQVLLKSAGIVR